MEVVGVDHSSQVLQDLLKEITFKQQEVQGDAQFEHGFALLTQLSDLRREILDTLMAGCWTHGCFTSSCWRLLFP